MDNNNFSLVEDAFEDVISDDCEYSPPIFLEWKMVFVGIIGLIVALISIIHNSLLFYTFSTSTVLRKRNLTYLMWISGCDVFISLCYIAIMCVQVYTDYFESFNLLVLWHEYLRAAFTVSHITLSAASFLLMAATIERYLQSTADNRTLKLFQILATHRTYVVFFCFLGSLIFRGTVFFEIEVVTQPNCTGFSSMGLAVVPMFGESMDVVWRFFVRKIVTVFLPFAVLAYFNAAIVMNVRRTDRDQTVKALVLFITVGTRGEVTRLRSRLRAVTRMLVMVVTGYLLANILDIIIAFWETINIQSLQELPSLYTVLSDISSFLPIAACALRLPIYTINDRQIRVEVRRKFCDILTRCCACCPCILCNNHQRKKLLDNQLESERLWPKQEPTPKLEIRNYGLQSLIMARASLSTKEIYDIQRFRESYDV
uniref:G_PROTEIN_RECEP_F1_2 domain-containing protein n=1 Tax=Caenorhabditis tropicalis TaxID=1561998 RepID=A0A1I7V0I0_9PELO